MQTSERVPFCYRLSLERIRRVRYLTIYDFHQENIESVKIVMLSQVKTFDRLFFNEPLSLISLNIILEIVFCRTCNITAIQYE